MLARGKRRAALMAMVELAKQYSNGPTGSGDLAREIEMSVSYLEQVLPNLKRAGLVSGVRGPGGGYMLSRSPDQICLADIIDAVSDDEVVPVLIPVENEYREVMKKFTLYRLCN